MALLLQLKSKLKLKSNLDYLQNQTYALQCLESSQYQQNHSLSVFVYQPVLITLLLLSYLNTIYNFNRRTELNYSLPIYIIIYFNMKTKSFAYQQNTIFFNYSQQIYINLRMQFLNIPLPTSDNHLHCLISPRSHHYPTLHKHHLQNFDFKSHEEIQHPLSCTRIQTNTLDIDTYDGVRQNYLQIQSPYLYETRMTHSKSLNTTPNKFYAFKKIRQDRIKQQNSIGKVIKAVKMKQRIKVISKLDEIKTIQSQNSPRQSLNSQRHYPIEESLIIMKGKDLYDDLMAAGTYDLLNSPSLSKSICYSPDTRKQLQQQSFSNRQNIHINIRKQNENSYETPTKLSFLKRQQMPVQSSISYFQVNFNTNPQKQKNRLSFLKSRKQNCKN